MSTLKTANHRFIALLLVVLLALLVVAQSPVSAQPSLDDFGDYSPSSGYHPSHPIGVPQFGVVHHHGDTIKVSCLDRGPNDQGSIQMTNRVPVGLTGSVGSPSANCTLTYIGFNRFYVTVQDSTTGAHFTQTFYVSD